MCLLFIKSIFGKNYGVEFLWQLARRVREMRESKAVHVVPKVEKPKGLPSVQSLPRGMEFVDPLGLG